MNPVDSFALGFVLAALFSGACAWSYCRRAITANREDAYRHGYNAGQRAAWSRD